MVTFQNKEILIDGKPLFLLSGELHYFRQPRENWQRLLDEAKAMGLNCIASYVPWILHEEREGAYCFEGNLDLGAFIDLCGENGLYFFVRPGPFIMAEMKKEGIPYWVAKKHPSAAPVGFGGERSSSNNLDYLDAGYLTECRKWYARVMKIIAPRLQSAGGNIIGVQLDNEIGMLSWVCNQPVLNDAVLERFAGWLRLEYSAPELAGRYPFDLADPARRAQFLRSPQEAYAVEFHLDFGRFMRSYYARYIEILRAYAQENGVRDVPFFINVHGTGESRIFDFPLGLSQLYEGYNQGEGMISGTDVYLGEPTEGKYQDLYVVNALADSVNHRGNPLTSIEFECSDGPYCSLSGMRVHPSATSHKMLMCLSQNARMLSFYVFSGGENYLLKAPEEDGNERMAFTGQLHGMNAPVQPDGTHSYSYDAIARTARAVHALNGLIAVSRQETDGVTLGFIPDLFLTELQDPASARTKEIFDNLRRWRCAGAIDSAARGLLSCGVHFDAADIQHAEIPAGRLLVVLSARYMPADVQRRVADFLENGGKVFFYGELPEYDLEGNPCGILLSALGLSRPVYLRSSEPGYFLTLRCRGAFQDAAPDQRAAYAQCFEADGGAILSPFDSDRMCGFIKKCAKGTACAVTADYPADMRFYARVWEELQVRAALRFPYYRQGVYLARTCSPDGQRLIYLLNLDCVDKKADILLDGKPLFRDFFLAEKAGLILPLGVRVQGGTVVRSTAQIVECAAAVRLLLTQESGDLIELETNGNVFTRADFPVTQSRRDGFVTLRTGPGLRGREFSFTITEGENK